MIFIIVSILIILFDQYTKYLALTYLQEKSIPVIENVFSFTYVENKGAAFGILHNNTLLLLAISVAIFCAIIFYLIKYKPQSRILKVSFAFVIGGAIGNMIDRFFRGFVVDFLDFNLINYPVFNVADCFVVIGAILFALYIIFIDDKNKSQKEGEKTDGK